MTLDQIRVLSTIVQTGSFRGAAELLHRTQPTLSVAIRNLEREFGFELFDWANYRPVLTTEKQKSSRKLGKFWDRLRSWRA